MLCIHTRVHTRVLCVLVTQLGHCLFTVELSFVCLRAATDADVFPTKFQKF